MQDQEIKILLAADNELETEIPIRVFRKNIITDQRVYLPDDGMPWTFPLVWRNKDSDTFNKPKLTFLY